MERSFENNDSDDERQLDEEKNKEGINSNKNDLHPSISDSIIKQQQTTGVRKNLNSEEQSKNPSLNFNRQNGNGLINIDNNNDSSSYASKQNNNPNINPQFNNLVNQPQNPSNNSNNNFNNQNFNNNNYNFNNYNNNNLNNNNYNNNNLNNNNYNNNNLNNNNLNNNMNNNNNYNNNMNNNNNYNNNMNNNNNYNNNLSNGNHMNSLGNQNYSQRQVINQNNSSNNFPNNNNNPMNSNNPNIQNQMSNKIQFPFSNIRNPINTLLIKMGESQYLNSILYLIGNIKVLCEYFYTPNQKNDFVKNIDKAPLSFIIYRLFLHLYPSSGSANTSYKPDAFKRYLSSINCVYKSEKRRNPNELFSFILDTLHNELKMPPSSALEIPNDVFNRKNVIDTGNKNFEMCDKSQISEYFNWCEIKATRCTQCSKIMYSFHTYHMFELDIINTSQCHNNNNPITIYDCLNYYQTIKRNLRAYCKSCNKNTIVDCGLQIYSNPKIFIFSLNRGLVNGRADDNLTDIKFKLHERIDLNNFVENNQINRQYELKGIISISHRLEDNYVSFCKSPVDNNWYLYDSEKVQPTNMNYILSEHNTTREDNYIPCILVYQSI